MLTIQELTSLYGQRSEIYDTCISANDAFYDLHNAIFNNDIFDVRNHPYYPIGDDRVRDSGYVERKQDQEAIVDQYLADKPTNFHLVIGPEGSGKSTCIHYSLGHLLNKRYGETKERTRFILVDAGAWIGTHKVEGFKAKIFETLELKLAASAFGADRDDFEARVKSLPQLTAKILTRRIADPVHDTTQFLGYLASIPRYSALYPFNTVVIFDNMDTLTGSQQRDLMTAIIDLHADLHGAAVEHYAIDPSPVGIKSGLCFIVPMRPNTWATVNSGQSMLWPPPESYSSIVLGHGDRPDLWHILCERLARLKKFNNRSLHKILTKTVQTDSGFQFGSRADDAEDYISSLIYWLSAKDHVFSGKVLDLCGGSIRRASCSQ